MDFFKIGVLGFFLSMILIYLSILTFPKLGLLDFPERYNLKRKRLPYPGGIIILFLSFLLFFIDIQFYPVVVGSGIIGLISFLDDRKDLSSIFRLTIQVVVAVFIFIWGIRIDFIGNPFASTNIELYEILPLVSFVVTILWIIIIQNALNWFDGIPGLSVGISGVGFLVLGLLGLIRPELFLDPSHTTLTLANFYLSGLCFGGFYFFWKKKILLGDTGSQILGFLLAVMAIFSGAKIATLLLVLMLPILDFFVVIFRRIFIERVSPFTGDLKHIHHNLSIKVGESSSSIILIIISLLFGIIAISLTGVVKIISLLFAIIIIFGFILSLSKK